LKHLLNISLITLLIACQSTSRAQQFQTVFDFKHDSTSHHLSNSNLAIKCKKMQNDRYRFEPLKCGKIIANTSRVYNAILDKSEMCHFKHCYFISDTNDFKKSIHQINYVKGKFYNLDDSGSDFNAGVEEIIFYHEDDAKTLVNYISQLRNIEYFWESLDKSPFYIFQESNKVYFVRLNHLFLLRGQSSLAMKMGNLMKEKVVLKIDDRGYYCERF